MIKIMVRGIIKIDIGQIVETEEYHMVVEYSKDRITETDQGTIRIIEVILEEGICDQIRIIEIKTIEVDIEEIIEAIIMKEVETGLGRDSIQIIPEGMIGLVVGLDLVQELVPTEIELDVKM